jgi:hypothetical protein
MNRLSRILACAVFATGLAVLPAGAQSNHPGRPGTINYVEGDASIGTEALTAESAGSIELARGETLTTKTGKVEILLTPGVFLRVDDNSSVTMISPDLADIEVRVEEGRAAVEVLQIQKANDIRLDMNDVSTQLIDEGLYTFDAEHDQILAFQGKAEVFAGNQQMKLKGGRLVALETGPLKAMKFDSRQYEDNFYRWCELRSGYLSEASADAARAYVGIGPGWYGPGWYGSGWYWDTDFFAYTFVPSDGIFYSPFGWGFYSPLVIYRNPFYQGSHFGVGHGGRFNHFHHPYGHGFEHGGGSGMAGGFHGRGRR